MVSSTYHKPPITQSPPTPLLPAPLRQNVSLCTLFSNTLSLPSSPNMTDKFHSLTNQQEKLYFPIFNLWGQG